VRVVNGDFHKGVANPQDKTWEPCGLHEGLYRGGTASSPPNELTGRSSIDPWVLLSIQMQKAQCDQPPHVAATSVSALVPHHILSEKNAASMGFLILELPIPF